MLSRLWRLVAAYWEVLWTPAKALSLGFLTIGGFIAGIIFWGGFNTALEVTNTEKFCTSCHEMRDNVFVELKRTIHYSNRSGVRASCPDCHVPHEWTYKIIRNFVPFASLEDCLKSGGRQPSPGIPMGLPPK